METDSPGTGTQQRKDRQHNRRRTIRSSALRVTIALAPLLALVFAGCATAQAPARRPTQVYEISVASVDGYPTSNKGPAGFPACTIQVGTKVAQVWLAHPANLDAVSPVVMTGDAASLKEGILVERTWREAVVHQVTDAELAIGVAVVYVPGFSRRHTVVELRFQPLGAGDRSGRDDQDDLPEDRARLKRAVAKRDVL